MPAPTTVEGLTRRSALEDGTRLLVQARLLDVRRFEAKLARAPYAVDPVHDMRVAARRLREALHILGSKQLRSQEPAVKRLQDALGAVRDAQLLGAWLRRHRLPALARKCEQQLHRGSRALAKALTQWSEHTVPALAEALAEERRKGRLGGPKVARRLRKRLDAVRERTGPVLEAPSPAPAHALRKAVKKLRYAAELCAPAFSGLERLQEAVAPLQGALGELHDVDVRLSLIRRSAPRSLFEKERDARAALGAALIDSLVAFRDSGVEKKARKRL